MDERTLGLILRVRTLTETSLIVHWLTRDHGRISTVAKGARRPKSPFGGKLDLFYLADLSFHLSRRGELHNLREVKVRQFHTALRRDLGLLERACYFAHLLEQTTESNTPLPAVFDIFAGSIASLAGSRAGAAGIFAFETKLAAELGFDPNAGASRLSLSSREVLRRLPTATWDDLSRLQLSRAQALELNAFLGRFLTDQFGRVPKSRGLAVGLAL